MSMLRYGDTDHQPEVVPDDGVRHMTAPTQCPSCSSTNLQRSGNAKNQTLTCLSCKKWSTTIRVG